MWLSVRKQKKQPAITLPQPAKGMACAASPGQVSSGAGDGKPPPEEQSREFSIRNWGKRTKAKVCLLHCVIFLFYVEIWKREEQCWISSSVRAHEQYVPLAAFPKPS